MGKPFVNLHTHSFYSILGASAAPRSILEKAKELEYPAVALTDTGAGYGLVEFFEAAGKIGDIKPILGAEIFVAKDSRFERRAGIDGREGYIVLLAKNQTGCENLLKILSLSHLEGFYYKPRADWELLEAYSEGLTVLTGATGGLIGRELRDGTEKKAEAIFEKLQTIFGVENVFLELVARSWGDQQKLNEWKVKLGEHLKANFVVSSDARYVNAEDEEACDTLFCIGKNQTITDPGRTKFAEKNWFKSFEEITEELNYLPAEILESARENTLKIAESVDFEFEFGVNHLPEFAVPEGETIASELRKKCEAGIKNRFPLISKEHLKEVEERLDYELSVIGKMGFEAYFLIVADFIQFAKTNGIMVGPGRGSAAGSIVAYLLEITNIDPIRYELLFERFLNPERISMPDIDIDFSDERRDEVLQYVTEKYGTEKVSKVCTFGTLAAKAALKDVGRAQGVAFSEMNAMTKILPNRPGFTLKDAEKVPDFQTLIKTKSHLKKVFDVATKLEGCVRHVSVHACAVMIAAEELTKYTPVQWAPGAEEIKITQFPYQQLEHLGLLKMDFLGLKNLSVLEKAVANIKLTTGKEIDLTAIPVDDEKVFQMMAEGETTGVFQFESAGMRRYLKELKPTEFEDLVAMNALYRPGPMEYIPQYIEGKHNPEKVKYMHPVLEPILKKTYGIAVYQEQVLKIAQVFAGFSLGEADILRKAIGKKIASILAKEREHFIEGAVAQGNDKKLAIKIFDEIIVPFSGYGFNRSHAVCYARIAYETAYLRANYPVEFMAAMMTTDRNNTDRIVLEMNECAAMEIEVLPPSVNESGSYFTVINEQRDSEQLTMSNEQLKSEGRSQKVEVVDDESRITNHKSCKNPELKTKNYELRTKRIRFGLSAIKGLGEDTVDQIIFERQKSGVFKSLSDFAKRVPAKLINKKTLEALAFSGAFDGFGDRKAVVDSLDDLSRFAREHQDQSEAGQMGLFGGTDEKAMEFTLKDSVATKEDILAWERESMGLYVSDHPLKGMEGYFKKYGTLIGHLGEEDIGKKKAIHGLVTSVRKIVTKRGQNMAILTIEDTSGKLEGAIFPQIYESIPKEALVEDAFLRVRGKVDERDGAMNIIIDEVKVGNLKVIQEKIAAGEIFESSEDEASGNRGGENTLLNPPSRGEALRIEIPQGTVKGKIDDLKAFLIEKKTDDPSGREVVVVIDGKDVKLPFRVGNDKKLEKEIKAILS